MMPRIKCWELEDRQKFVQRMLETMCWIAENADLIRGNGVTSAEPELKSFKPTLGDKWRFKRIIEENYKDLRKDLTDQKREPLYLGVPALSLLNLFYAQYYLPREERVLGHEGAMRFERLNQWKNESWRGEAE